MTLSTWLAFLLQPRCPRHRGFADRAPRTSSGRRPRRYAAARHRRSAGGLADPAGNRLCRTWRLADGLDNRFRDHEFVGAGYLVWLGIQKWRDAPRVLDEASASERPNGLFVQGLLVNLTNPKAIFMAALTPQFIDPARCNGSSSDSQRDDVAA